MDPKLILFALHEMKDIGWVSILKIVQNFPDISDLLSASPQNLQDLGIRAAQARTISEQLTHSFVDGRLAAYKRNGIQVLTIFDDAYPYLLKQSAQPPWVLYCKGNLQLLNNPIIAIVGTRVPTVYGKNTAEQFGEDLAKAGVTVVSGLARGIDSSAHYGALKQAGSTIAVLGCGVDVIYPLENTQLYQQIASKGLLISEFPLGTPAHPGLFPLRNRIIAGLCLGTLVVEAAAISGSIITANMSLDEGRDLFIIPGQINSPKSQGVFKLLAVGAKVVICVEDILVEYGYLFKTDKLHLDKTKVQQLEAILDESEQRIIDILNHAPATFDSILEETQTNFGHLHAILLSLVMKKAINQLPGSIYSIR
jgi:DNA processing protein